MSNGTGGIMSRSVGSWKDFKKNDDDEYFKTSGFQPYGRQQHTQQTSNKLQSESTREMLLCLIWYTLSSTGSVLNKYILTKYLPGYPTSLTFMHLLVITFLMPALNSLWRIPVAQSLSRRYTYRFILPLAFGKFFSSVASQFSIYKVPVSYSHTVKATMPLFTVMLTRMLFGDRHHAQVWMSLLPIVFGVALATVTELQFNWLGMISALASTAAFSLQNIYWKRVLKETRMHHLRLLYLLSRTSFIMLLPIWFFADARTLPFDRKLTLSTHKNPLWVLVMLVCSGLIMFAQNIVAFTVISILTPVSYSVANAGKRIAVIVFSIVTLKNKVTPLNIAGMMISVTGVYVYNRATL